jgi:hypothetical protein
MAAAPLAEGEDFNLPLGCLVADLQHVSYADFTRGLGALTIRSDAAHLAGL